MHSTNYCLCIATLAFIPQFLQCHHELYFPCGDKKLIPYEIWVSTIVLPSTTLGLLRILKETILFFTHLQFGGVSFKT
jgi:hypothetical protein